MGNARHLMHRTRILLGIWISLALILAPAAALAAPTAAPPAQATPYQDPDARFTLDVPDEFSEQIEVTYDVMGDNPLDELLASSGVAFTDVDGANAVSVLFLLLDETIRDRDVFAGFLAAFQTAAGGEVLPLVDLEFVPGDALRAEGQATTRERSLQIWIEAQDNVAVVVSATAERARYRELRDGLDAALDSFTWDPETVRTSLGGEAPATPEEPEAEEPAVEEPEVEEPQAEDVDVEAERYTDPNGVFSVSFPPGLDAEDLSDDIEAIYGFGYSEVEGVNFPAAAVAFTPAAYAAEGAEGEVDFRAIDDDEFNDFVDTFLLEDVSSDMTVYQDQRDEVLRTAFVILEATEVDEYTPPEMWVWIEESDGVGAVFVVAGQLDAPQNSATFHEALKSFTWSPQAAKSAIAEIAGLPDPAEAPVPFVDPLALIEAVTPPDYPFQSSYFGEDSVEYSFGRNAIDGLFRISLSTPSDEAFNAEGWSLIVDATEQSVLDTLSDGSLGANARSISTEMDALDVGADNSALILARTDVFWMAVALLDVDGVLVSEVVIVPDSYWQEQEDVVMASIQEGVDFDPDSIRSAIELTTELGATVLSAVMTDEVPAAGEELEESYLFDPDEEFTMAVDFAESDLTSSFKAVVYVDDLPDFPLAQYGMWLGDELSSFGKMTVQQDSGTRAAFTYQPEYATTPGTYTAVLYYDNEQVASLGFTVEDVPVEEPELTNFGVYYGDVYDNEPILITKAIHPGDVVNVRGTGELPAGSQLRLFWYGPDGWLVPDEVLTIRLDTSFHSLYDWIYFDTVIDWQPGYYSYLLTLNGEPLADGELLVVEETAEVELTPDGGEVFAGLPLVGELETLPVVEGYDLAVAPSDEYPDVDVISAVDAWLRMQGWEPTLPPAGAPVSWDYRRWVKDGYQFLLQPGPDGAETEIWMRYAPASDMAFGALPADDPLDAENLAVLDEVAEVEIPGLSAADAALSPDGNWLAVTTTDGTLYFFDAHRLMDAIWWQPAEAIYADPVFSPDSRYLAVTVQGQSRSQVQIFRNFDVVWLPTTLLDGHTAEITAIDYQPDGWLISGGLDSSLRQWDLTADYLPTLVETDGPVTGAAAAPEDASGMLVGLDGGLVEYRLDDTSVAWSDLGALTQAPQIAVWPEFDDSGVGDLAVYGGGQVEWFAYGTDGAELVGNLPEDNPEFASTGAAFSANGSLLVIGGPYVAFFDRASGAPLGDWDVTVEEGALAIDSLGFSPDGRYVIAVTGDGLLRMWAAAAR